MPTNYDSDSSDDANEYTTTDVILGYATAESGGDEISHIGGHPIWLDDHTPPAADLSRCKNCKGHLSLLLQLNADLQQHFPNDTRRIYVFSCRDKKCARKPGSIRAFREVKKSAQARRTNADTRAGVSETNGPATSTQAKKQENGPGLGTMLFGGKDTSLAEGTNINPFSSLDTGISGSGINYNPFASGSNSNSNGKITSSDVTTDDAAGYTATVVAAADPPSETFAEKLKINTEPAQSAAKPAVSSTREAWPEQSAFPPPYPQFYLDAYPEELDPEPPSSSIATKAASKVSYEAEDTGGGRETDTFESTLDKTFQKFSDIIAQNPEQVLRYEFRGQPLLYSSSDGVSSRFVVPHGKVGAVKGMPRCESCGAQRVFELQLMPYLILEVEKDEAMDIEDGMEWGTIVVGACGNNCGLGGEIAYREEWVGVQWEERISKK